MQESSFRQSHVFRSVGKLPPLLLAFVLALPILGILFSVFSKDAGAWAHITATILPDLLTTSLILAAVVAVGVIVIGTTTAWLTANYEFPGRSFLEWALILPLAMPAYVMAYAYTDALQYAGPVQTWLREWFDWQGKSAYWFPDIRSIGGAATILMFVLYPYVFMLARVAFLEQSPSLREAGTTFGYSPWRLFMRVSLPLARPAVAAGTALALMETLADYGTVSYFGLQTFTTGIFNAWFSLGDRIAAAKLSAILLVFVALIIFVEQNTRRRSRYFQTGKGRTNRTPLSAISRWIATMVCALPLMIGFVIPTLILLKQATADDALSSLFSTRFAALVFNTVTLATITAAIAVMLALWLAYTARKTKSPISTNANRLIGIGYAIPGTIIAVGVLIPVIKLDHLLVDTLNGWFGTTWGLLLTGSLGVLVYAYLIRFLAVALQSVEAGLTKITPSMDDAAQSLGATRFGVLKRIHIPLLRPSLVTAALLVFVDVMKELPATLVLRPFNFDTLAVHVYVLAKDERLAEAAWPALAMVAVGLLPVLIASRQITRANTSINTIPQKPTRAQSHTAARTTAQLPH
jgi:iron(III) transport system permease protein